MAAPDVDPDAMWKPGYQPPADQAPPPTEAAARSEPPAVPAATAATAAAVDDAVPAADPDAPAPPSPWDRVTPDDDGGVELFVPSQPAAPAPPRPRRRRRRSLAALATVAVLVAGVALVLVRGDRDGPADPGELPRVPDGTDVTWTATLDGDVAAVLAVDDLVLVAHAGRAARIVALDARDGGVRWAAPLGRSDALGELLVVDGHVVVTTAGRIPTVRELDPSTGETRWRRRIRASDSVAGVFDSLVVISAGDDGVRLQALDPATGAELGTADDLTSLGPDGAIRVDGDRASVFDVALRPLGDEIELGATPIDAVVVADVVVISVPGQLRAIELDGRERWRLPIDAVDARYLFASAARPGEVLVVSTSAMRAIDVRGADPVTRWEVDGLPVVRPNAQGTRWVPVRTAPGSGELRALDLRDGSVDAVLDTSDASRTLFGEDAVVLGRATGDGEWELHAAEYATGGTRWQVRVVGDPELVDGGIVGLDRTDDRTVLTYVGDG